MMTNVQGFDAWTVPKSSQSGQAMVEAIVSLMVLGVLIHVVAATDRLQDLALRASLAGRYAATLLTRQAEPGRDLASDVANRFFAGPRHRWQTRQGEPMLAKGPSSVQVAVAERRGVAGMQVGQRDSLAAPIRQEVLRRDHGIMHATVEVVPRLGLRKTLNRGSGDQSNTPGSFQSVVGHVDRGADRGTDRGTDRRGDRIVEPGVDRGADPLGLAGWESRSLRLRRHTAILTDAGHADSDAGVTARLQASPQTWGTAAARSAQHGREVAAQLAPLDRAWRRPAPRFDWLTLWQDLVPADRVGKSEDVSWR